MFVVILYNYSNGWGLLAIFVYLLKYISTPSLPPHCKVASGAPRRLVEISWVLFLKSVDLVADQAAW